MYTKKHVETSNERLTASLWSFILIFPSLATWEVIFNFVRVSCARDLVDTGPCGHLTGQNYFDGENQRIGPKIPDYPFRGHFVSGSGGMGTRLHSILVGLQLCKKHVSTCSTEWANILTVQRLAIPNSQPDCMGLCSNGMAAPHACIIASS